MGAGGVSSDRHHTYVAGDDGNDSVASPVAPRWLGLAVRASLEAIADAPYFKVRIAACHVLLGVTSADVMISIGAWLHTREQTTTTGPAQSGGNSSRRGLGAISGRGIPDGTASPQSAHAVESGDPVIVKSEVTTHSADTAATATVL